jgi:hypothetical protein
VIDHKKKITKNKRARETYQKKRDVTRPKPAELKSVPHPSKLLLFDEFAQTMQTFFQQRFRKNVERIPNVDILPNASKDHVDRVVDDINSLITRINTENWKSKNEVDEEKTIINYGTTADRTLNVVVGALEFLRVCLLKNVNLVDNARRRGRCCFLATRLYGPEGLYSCNINKNTFTKNDYTYPAFLAQLFTKWFPGHRMLNEFFIMSRATEIDFSNNFPNPVPRNRTNERFRAFVEDLERTERSLRRNDDNDNDDDDDERETTHDGNDGCREGRTMQGGENGKGSLHFNLCITHIENR